MSKYKTNKVLSYIMAVVLIVSLFAGLSIPASATNGTWTGSGTSSSPYIISDSADLFAIANGITSTNSYAGVYFRLNADIDVSTNSTWAGIGSATIANVSYDSPYVSSGNGFAGEIDGNGHTITVNRTASNSAVGGVVNYLTSAGKVKNMTVTGSVTVSGTYDAIGGVVGYNEGTISNVSSSVTVYCNNSFNVGGIAGFNNGYYNHSGTQASSGSLTALIEECSNSGPVSSRSKTGGIVGENAGTVQRCYNVAAITNTYSGKNGAGGIAGRNGNNDTPAEVGYIIDCYNTGAISSYGGSWVGGIAGFQSAGCTIQNTYNTGNLSGGGYLDQTVGKNEGTLTRYFGLDSVTGAEDYDNTVEVSSAQLSGTTPYDSHTVLYYLNGLNNSGAWTQGTGTYTYPVLNSASFTIVKASNPTKLTYTAGEYFNASGLVINAVYSDQTVQITNYTISNTNALTTSDTSVDIYGIYNGISFSFNVPITVNTAGTYTFTKHSDPHRLNYAEGETFSVKGMVVFATSGGPIYVIGSGFTVSNTNPLTTSDTSITISGSYDGESYSFTLPITVSPVSLTVGTSSTVYTSLDSAMTAAKAGSSTAERTIYVSSTTPILGNVDGGASGVTIKRASGFSGIMLTLGNVNSQLSNLTIDGNNISGTNLIRTYDGTLRLDGTVTLQNAVSTATGGAIHVQGGTVTSYAKFDNCQALNGGAVAVTSTSNLLQGTFIMASGTNSKIINCTATNYGGGVYIGNGGTFTMNGGLISGNTASTAGTAVYVGETFILDGSYTINGNIYLARDKYIIAKSALSCNLNITLADTSNYPVLVDGVYYYDLTPTDKGKITCTNNNDLVILETYENLIYYNHE